MRYSSVEVRKQFNLIQLETGSVYPCRIGIHEIIPRRYQHPKSLDARDYFVLKSSPGVGAITSFWENKENDGECVLTRQAEDTDVMHDGVKFPITSRDQLTNHQAEDIWIGVLIQGVFHCSACAIKSTHDRTFPMAVKIMPWHIMPYSQDCRVCGVLMIDMWRTRKGPRIMFTGTL